MPRAISGARMRLLFNGSEIGFATNVQVSENRQHVRVDVLGNAYSEDIELVGVAVQGSAETVVIDGQLLPDGVFTQGESVDLINIPSVSGELYDRLGDRITTRIEGIKFESRSISLQARGLKTRNIGFQAIRLTEE